MIKSIMRVALVPSVNGFGHTRRLLSIAVPLRNKGIDCEFLLPCQLGYKSKLVEIITQKNFQPKIICSNGTDEGPYINFRKHSDCFSTYNKDTIKIFDHVICDTVTWLHNWHTSTFLFAQFTWTIFADNYKKIIEKDLTYLQFKKIYGMKYFTQSSLLRLKTFQSTPILDYWGLSKFANVKAEPKILIAGNGAENIFNLLKGFDIDLNSEIVYGLENYVKHNSKPLGIICRAGLSTIVECLSANIVPILLKSTDAELLHNYTIAVNMKWAVPFDLIFAKSKEEQINYLYEFQDNICRPEVLLSTEFVNLTLMKEIA